MKRVSTIIVLVCFMVDNTVGYCLSQRSSLSKDSPGSIVEAVIRAADAPGSGTIGSAQSSFYRIEGDELIIDEAVVRELRPVDKEALSPRLSELAEKFREVKDKMRPENRSAVSEVLNRLNNLFKGGQILTFPAKVRNREDFLLGFSAKVQLEGGGEKKPVLALCEEHLDPEHPLYRFLGQGLIHELLHMLKPSLNLSILHRAHHQDAIEMAADFLKGDFPEGFNAYGLALRRLINERAGPAGLVEFGNGIEEGHPFRNSVLFTVNILIHAINSSELSSSERRLKEILGIINPGLEERLIDTQLTLVQGALQGLKTIGDINDFPIIAINIDTGLEPRREGNYLVLSSVESDKGRITISLASAESLERLHPRHLLTAILAGLVYKGRKVYLRSLEPEGIAEEWLMLMAYYLWENGIGYLEKYYTNELQGKIIDNLDVSAGENTTEIRQVKAAVNAILATRPKGMSMYTYYEKILRFFYPRVPRIRIVDRLDKEDEEAGRLIGYQSQGHTIIIPRYSISHNKRLNAVHVLPTSDIYHFYWHLLLGLWQSKSDVLLNRMDEAMLGIREPIAEGALLNYLSQPAVKGGLPGDLTDDALAAEARAWTDYSEFHFSEIRPWREGMISRRDSWIKHLSRVFQAYYDRQGLTGCRAFWNLQASQKPSLARMDPDVKQVKRSLGLNIRGSEDDNYVIEGINEEGQVRDVASCKVVSDQLQISFNNGYQWLIYPDVLIVVVNSLINNLGLSTENLQIALPKEQLERFVGKVFVKDKAGEYRFVELVPLPEKEVTIEVVAEVRVPVRVETLPLPLTVAVPTVGEGLVYMLSHGRTLTAAELPEAEGITLPTHWSAGSRQEQKRLKMKTPYIQRGETRMIDIHYMTVEVNEESFSIEAPEYVCDGVFLSELHRRIITAIDNILNTDLDDHRLNNRLNDIKNEIITSGEDKVKFELDQRLPRNGIKIEGGMEFSKPVIVVKGKEERDIRNLSENDWLFIFLNYFLKGEGKPEYIPIDTIRQIQKGESTAITGISPIIRDIYYGILHIISIGDSSFYPVRLARGFTLHVTDRRRLQGIEITERGKKIKVPLLLAERAFNLLEKKLRFRDYILNLADVGYFLRVLTLPRGEAEKVVGDIGMILRGLLGKREVGISNLEELAVMDKGEGSRKDKLLAILTNGWQGETQKNRARHALGRYLSTDPEIVLLWTALMGLNRGIARYSSRRNSLKKRQLYIVFSDEGVLQDKEDLVHAGSRLGANLSRTPIWLNKSTLIALGNKETKMREFIEWMDETDRYFTRLEAPKPEKDIEGRLGFSLDTRRRNIAALGRHKIRFDILVIGGGLLGASIAREAAMCNLGVALYDRGDFVNQATMPLIFSEEEGATGYFGRFLKALFRRDRSSQRRYWWLIRWYIARLRRELKILKHIEPRLKPDAPNSTAHLALETLISSHRYGATVVNYVDFKRYIYNEQGQITGAVVIDLETGREFPIYADQVVDATGYTGLSREYLDEGLRKPMPYQVIQREDTGLIITAVTETLFCRKVAREVVAHVQEGLGQKVRPAPTDKEPLPRAGGLDLMEETEKSGMTLLEQLNVNISDLKDRYGVEYPKIAAIIQEDPEFSGKIVDVRDLPYIKAEIVYAARHQMVLHLGDFLLRRTPLAQQYSLNPKELDTVAQILGRELGWDNGRMRLEIERYKEEELKEFIRRIFRYIHWELEGSLRQAYPFQLRFIDESKEHKVRILQNGQIEVHGGFLRFVGALRGVKIKELDVATSLVYSTSLHELRGHLAHGHLDTLDNIGTNRLEEMEAVADQERGRRYQLFNIAVALWHMSLVQKKNVSRLIEESRFKWLQDDNKKRQEVFEHINSIKDAVGKKVVPLTELIPPKNNSPGIIDVVSGLESIGQSA